MTDSLADILGKQRYDEPPEVVIIQQFLAETFQASGKVTIASDQIIITVASSALAGSLRMHLHELKRRCRTKKRLAIRIG